MVPLPAVPSTWPSNTGWHSARSIAPLERHRCLVDYRRLAVAMASEEHLQGGMKSHWDCSLGVGRHVELWVAWASRSRLLQDADEVHDCCHQALGSAANQCSPKPILRVELWAAASTEQPVALYPSVGKDWEVCPPMQEASDVR